MRGWNKIRRLRIGSKGPRWIAGRFELERIIIGKVRRITLVGKWSIPRRLWGIGTKQLRRTAGIISFILNLNKF